VERVINLLEDNLGIPSHPGKRNALQVLIVTILSQNTTDPSALKAYERMLERFPTGEDKESTGELPRTEDGDIDSVKLRMSQVADTFPSPDWDAVREAESAELEDAISVCGLQQSKAATIQRSLSWLKERTNSYRLETVIEDHDDPYETARTLSEIKGVGIKTAAVTLMESDKMDVCPVDTHVHRIAQRLRLVEPSSSRKKTFRELQPLIPDGKGHSFHHNLLTFGRTTCTAKNPDCDDCFLQAMCHYYRVENQGEDRSITFKQ
jgi:endonuclease-3